MKPSQLDPNNLEFVVELCEQQRWDTPEKESFAIFVALTKWEHILRDVKFRLRTDHKNLTYLNFAGSNKVFRWKLRVQSYDFDIEHIPGQENVVADCLSRLCPIEGATTESVNAIFETNGKRFPGYGKYLDDTGRLPPAALTTIKLYHNTARGHNGVDRTIQEMNREGVPSWKYQRKHIEYYIRYVCPCCQKMSQLKPLIHANPFCTSAYIVMMLINIDLIGPLPEDKYGNAYILVIRDTFSKWTDLHAIRNKEAESIVRPLLRFFGTFGVPQELRTDGGKEFVNSTMAKLIEKLEVEHSITLAYSHEENGAVERANKEVLRRLRDLVFDTRLINVWSDMLPAVQRLMNSKTIDSVGFSPAQIIFGNAIDLDRHFIPSHIQDQTIDPAGGESALSNEIRYTEWVDILLANQQKIIAAAQEILWARDMKHLENRQTDSEMLTTFPVDALVLARYHDTGLGARPPTKLHPTWMGPFRVVHVSSDKNTYALQNLLDGKIIERHITDLKLFHYDEQDSGFTLEDIALRDYVHDFPVQEILGHRNNKPENRAHTRHSDLEFHVRWKGFSDNWNTWEPYKNVRLNNLAIEYMRNNGLSRFIPRNIEPDVVNAIPVREREEIERDEAEVRVMCHLRSSLKWVRNETSGKWISFPRTITYHGTTKLV